MRHYHDRLIDGNPAGQTLLYHSWLSMNKADPQPRIAHEKNALVGEPARPRDDAAGCARRGARTIIALEKDIEAYIAANNDEPKPFVWTKYADEILASIGRYCLRTLDATT